MTRRKFEMTPAEAERVKDHFEAQVGYGRISDETARAQTGLVRMWRREEKQNDAS